MKKIIKIAILSKLILIFSACGVVDEVAQFKEEYEAHMEEFREERDEYKQEDYTNGSGRNYDDETKYVSEQVKIAFETKDVELFKSLLAPAILEIENIDEQVGAFLNDFDGTEFTYENYTNSTGGGEKIHGVWTSLGVQGEYDNLITDNGAKYRFLSISVSYASEDTAYVGLTSVTFVEDKEIAKGGVGFWFNPFYVDYLIDKDDDGLHKYLEDLIGTSNNKVFTKGEFADMFRFFSEELYRTYQVKLKDDKLYLSNLYLERNVEILNAVALHHNMSCGDKIPTYDADFDGYLSEEEHAKLAADYPDYPNFNAN